MKTNFLKVSFMALAATVIASCSQENEVMENIAPEETTGQTLKIKASAAGFEAADAQTRATDNGATTVFENGDRMGLYIIENYGVEDAEAELINTVTLTYDGSTWTPSTPVYVYDNATYVAYFPYNANFKPSDINALEDELKATVTLTTDQSQNYHDLDLMIAKQTTAEITAASNTLDLDLTHTAAMIEFSIPVYNFSCTKANSTTFEYSIPMDDIKFSIGDVEYTPYKVNESTYRCLVAPAQSIEVSGSFIDPDDKRPVSFSNGESPANLAANNYIRYNVTYDEAPAETVEALGAIAVGDYLLNNGGILKPSTFQTVPASVVGIVYSVTTTDTNWPNGYAVALNDVEGKHTWNESAATSFGSYNAFTTGSGDETYWNKEGSQYATFFTTKNGQALCEAALTANSSEARAIRLADGYNETCPTTNTSGWYLPSPGELMELLNTLSGQEAMITTSASIIDAGNNKGTKKTAYDAIEEKLEAAGGSIMTVEDSYMWWTSAEFDASNAWALEWKTDGQIKFLSRDKISNKYYIRPILAF